MPELPEVETVVRGLRPAMQGARFARVEQRRADLRFPFPARFAPRLEGRTVVDVGRRAKYILAGLDDGQTLLVHLGMTGRFTVAPAGGAAEMPGRFHNAVVPEAAHEHVVFSMAARDGGGARIGYADPRRFGFMDLIGPGDAADNRFLARLGVEPLGDELTPERLAAAFDGRFAPLKAALLDQHIIAGLGNIYVCEALHLAGLSPFRGAGSLTGTRGRDRLGRLVAAIRTTLEAAIEAGGSTLRDFAAADGSLGYFQHRFRVYDRAGEPCPTEACPGRIRREVQSGRSTFFCPRCQK
jgi:formamidopyrimidine-DNA glycosylase